MIMTYKGKTCAIKAKPHPFLYFAYQTRLEAARVGIVNNDKSQGQ